MEKKGLQRKLSKTWSKFAFKFLLYGFHKVGLCSIAAKHCKQFSTQDMLNLLELKQAEVLMRHSIAELVHSAPKGGQK